VIAAGLMETGNFTHDDAVYVWGILAGSAVGLLASTLGRLYSSAYYAFRDTRTPLRYAIVRVALTTILGYIFAIYVPRWLNISESWGAAGLTASAGIAGWIEMALLRRTLNGRIGKTGLPPSFILRLAAAALAAAGVAWLIKLGLPPLHPKLVAMVVLVPYGLVYFGVTAALRVPEISSVVSRLQRRRA
jgi:putative peptidoglycan lipid II flippase